MCYRAPLTSVCYRAPLTSVCYRASLTSVCYRAPLTSVCYRAPLTSVCYRAPITSVCYRAPLTSVCYRAPLTSVCYRAPLTSAQEDEGIIELFLKASNEIPLVMGDFNFPGIKWESNEASGNEDKFLECIQDSFFTQHVLPPTRGDNVIMYWIWLCVMMKG